MTRIRRGAVGVAGGLLTCALVVGPGWGDIGGAPATVHVLTGARVVVAPGADPVEADLLIRDGRVVEIGADLDVPPGARVHDRTGRYVYPGWIDPHLILPEVEDEPARGDDVHENPAVRSDVQAVSRLPVDGDLLEAWREAGFTTARLVPREGILRGLGAVAGLVDGAPAGHVLDADAGQNVTFAPRSGPNFPNSIMGVMALIRQAHLDATWIEDVEAAWRAAPDEVERPRTDRSLAALRPVLAGETSLWLECGDLRMIDHGLRVAGELGDAVRPVVVSGGADEYREVTWLRETLEAAGAELVLAMNPPPPPYWELPAERRRVDLADLRHWEEAPTSPARVHEEGLRFAVTAAGLDDPALLHERLRTAIAHGLPADVALGAVTTEPARILGLADRVGTLEPGKDANLLVASGPLFEASTEVVEVWIDGRRHGDDPDRALVEDAEAEWVLSFPPDSWDQVVRVELEVEDGVLGGEVLPLVPETDDDADDDVTDDDANAGDADDDADDDDDDDDGPPLEDVRFELGEVRFTVPAGSATGVDAAMAVTARVAGDRLLGYALVEGRSRRLLGRIATDPDEEAPDSLLSPDAPAWPPDPETDGPGTLLVRNATIWTQGEAGRLENADLLVSAGLITAVGPSLDAPDGARVVDGTGLHLTPGLIDCHSHAALIRGSNEWSESVTCEVRVRDNVNPWSPHLYRQAAGGLTTMNLLHGSANAIGGQNAVLKLRRGGMSGTLLFREAPPGVKFALGENPKRANWGTEYTPRYPATRMGVAEVIRDRFLAARDYRREHARFDAGEIATPPRTDLELEAIAEILDGTRLIHCHSYRQDEILMLMRLCEEFGVTVGTFQHVLEGYKVADEMAAHGAGASCFSDWWNYKYEVIDAIPHNAAIMWERGVLVSINSDDTELARRMNLEAAKAVRYGGVPEEAALAMVTSNPAKQLGVDAFVGSLEPGKHADLALWSDHPLSDRAVCLETWIDGVRVFSREEDLALRAEMEALREALLEKAEEARKDGDGGGDYGPTFEGLRAGEAHEAPARGVCHDLDAHTHSRVHADTEEAIHAHR